MTEDARKSDRYRVHLAVRYATAKDFVIDYAENLSHGGLFLSGAQDLVLRQLVTVELTLPGADVHQVEAEVAHLRTAEEAAKKGGRPGAGLCLVNPSPAFQASLRAYLLRLGRRRDAVVMVSDLVVSRALAGAGYQVRALPLVSDFITAVTTSDEPVVGVVVAGTRALPYAKLADELGASQLVITLEREGEVDAILGRLDEALAKLG